mmetsp:Transcript_16441/g.29675  ORF Transcript_16441/g.29675 Transcript_16441/m.29675 type:complete len:161 (-) Transcript_16441:116-598(-)
MDSLSELAKLLYCDEGIADIETVLASQDSTQTQVDFGKLKELVGLLCKQLEHTHDISSKLALLKRLLATKHPELIKAALESHIFKFLVEWAVHPSQAMIDLALQVLECFAGIPSFPPCMHREDLTCLTGLLNRHDNPTKRVVAEVHWQHGLCPKPPRSKE